MPTYQRIDIAKAHLNRAIVLFIEERDFLNAITRSAAAEEILGKLASETNLTPAADQLIESLHNKVGGTIEKTRMRDDYLNRVKNGLKGFDQGDEEGIEIEPENEAITMILRAITNLVLVEGRITERAQIFYDHIKNARPDLFEGHRDKSHEDLTIQQEPGMQGPGTTIVAYVDILGYKNLTERIINNAQEVSKLERRLHTLTIGMKEKLKTAGAEAIGRQYQGLFLKVLETFSVRVVSDSIVFSMWVSDIHADTTAGKNRALAYCLETMFTVMSYSFSMIIAKTGHVLRGGISIGTHYEAERPKYLFVLSEPLNKAVLLEKDAKCARMLADTMLIAYLTEIAYEHASRFFYRDECGDWCFDWYGGLISFPDHKQAEILGEIRDRVTLNAGNSVGNKKALRNLVHFGAYHNGKVTESPLNYPDLRIDLTWVRSLPI
jgi:hypothetical protein